MIFAVFYVAADAANLYTNYSF